MGGAFAQSGVPGAAARYGAAAAESGHGPLVVVIGLVLLAAIAIVAIKVRRDS
jgi:hypothetical protein